MRNIKMKKAIILLIFMLSGCSSGYQSANMYYPIKDNQNKQIGSIYSGINISRWGIGGGCTHPIFSTTIK